MVCRLLRLIALMQCTEKSLESVNISYFHSFREMIWNRVYLKSVKGANTHATSSLVTCPSVDLFISVGADFSPKYQLRRKLKDFEISFGTAITLSWAVAVMIVPQWWTRQKIMDQLSHQIIAFVIILITGAVLDGPAFTIKIIAFVFNAIIILLRGEFLPSLFLMFWV